MVITGPSVSTVYARVVNDTVSKSRNDFLALGGRDELLDEIRAVWEMKLKQCGAIGGGGPVTPPAGRPSGYDLNVPYFGREVYRAPPAGSLFPMTPVQNPDRDYYHLPTPARFGGFYDADVKQGVPNSYADFIPISNKGKRGDSVGEFNFMGKPSQMDGVNDYMYQVIDSKEGIKKEETTERCIVNDDSTVEYPSGIAEGHDFVDGLEDPEPPLNEEDDIDDFDLTDEELETNHLILAQFDKVTRSKNKWKCTLKSGIMHINGKDTLFNQALGVFEF